MDIDFVVLWVDGNDPEWQREKARYSNKAIDNTNAVNRFRDWGLMKYWFRGIDKYAPWVRKVHFVTWGHLPDFLDPQAPKLNIVNHRDYLKEEYLPTFSSHTLEMNMHRIPGLTEYFVYFNDDMFLLKPVSKDYFFDLKKGLPRVYCSAMPLRITGINIPFQRILVNDLGILNKNIRKREQKTKMPGKYISKSYKLKDNLYNICIRYLFPEYYPGFKVFHCPVAFRKQTFEEIWNSESELLDKVSRNKFRTNEDVNQWLALYWQMAKGEFSAGITGKDSQLETITDDSIDRICKQIVNPDKTMMCINDPDGDVDFDNLSTKIREAFEVSLPDKCSFEK